MRQPKNCLIIDGKEYDAAPIADLLRLHHAAGISNRVQRVFNFSALNTDFRAATFDPNEFREVLYFLMELGETFQQTTLIEPVDGDTPSEHKNKQ